MLRSHEFRLLFGARMVLVAGFGVAGLCVGVTLPFYVGFRVISSGLQVLRCSLWLIYRPPS